MMTTAYRDPLERARETLAELTESLVRTLPAAEARERIALRRAARVVFGGVGIGGAVVLVVATILKAQAPVPIGLGPTEVLVSTWLVAGAAYVLARLFGMVLRRPRNPAPTGSILDDIRTSAAAVAARREGRFLGVLSVVLPAIAVSLLMPLTLHLAVWALFRGDRSYEEPAGAREWFTRMATGFDEWIALSLMIVGHAHLVLAALVARFAYRVARMPLADLGNEPSRGFKAVFWTAGVAAVPGIIFFAIPPLLVAVTGIAFVPVLWTAIRRIALRERTALQLAGVDFV